jgi:hypothetical protein
MHTWLRIALLSAGTAIGIAVALAVALNKPDVAGKVKATQPAAAAPAVESNAVAAPTPVVAEPVVAPYRDPIARQVGQLEESIQELEESSHRRERSMLRAIAAMQERTEDAVLAAADRQEGADD